MEVSLVDEVRGADLGDARLNDRLGKVVEELGGPFRHAALDGEGPGDPDTEDEHQRPDAEQLLDEAVIGKHEPVLEALELRHRELGGALRLPTDPIMSGVATALSNPNQPS